MNRGCDCAPPGAFAANYELTILTGEVNELLFDQELDVGADLGLQIIIGTFGVLNADVLHDRRDEALNAALERLDIN